MPLGPPIRRSRAQSVVLTAALAALVGATLVACGDLTLPAAAPDPVAASPSEKLAAPASPGGRRGPAEASQHVGHRDRRHALGRPAVDAERSAADPEQGSELRELVRAVPAVLPVPVELPERAVRAQPPRLHAPRALRLRGVQGPALDRHGPAGRGVPHRPGRQVPQRLRRAVPALGRVVAELPAAGMGPVVRRQRPPVGLRRPALRRGDVLLQPPGREHQRGDPVLPRPLLHRRRRRAGPRRDHRVQQESRAMVRVVDADRAAPRTAARVRRPVAHAADGRRVQRVGHPGATGLGQGTVRQPDHARFRDPEVAARPRRTPATSRTTCASCPSPRRRRRTRWQR